MDTIRSVTTTGPQITLDCPACGGKNVTGTTSEREESYRLLGIVPLMVLRNAFVTCGSCQRQLMSAIRLSDLGDAKPDELAKALSVRESFVGQVVAVLGLLLCWLPFVGLGLGLLGMLLNLRSAKWPRTLSQIATIVGIIVSLIFGVLLYLGVVH